MKSLYAIFAFSLSLNVLATDVSLISDRSSPTRLLDDPPTLVSRDIATVTSVVAAVSSGLTALTDAVTAFTPTSDPTAIQSISSALLATIRDGTTAIEGTTPLSLAEAVILQQAVSSLLEEGEGLVSALEAKKATFQQAGLCAEIGDMVAELRTAHDALVEAVVGKLPSAVQAIARDAAASLGEALAESEASFAAGSCVDAPSAVGAGMAPGAGGRLMQGVAVGAGNFTPTGGLRPTASMSFTAAATTLTVVAGSLWALILVTGAVVMM